MMTIQDIQKLKENVKPAGSTYINIRKTEYGLSVVIQYPDGVFEGIMQNDRIDSLAEIHMALGV